MIVYTLNKPLDCQKICWDIQNMIQKEQDLNQQTDKALVINLVSISDAIAKPLGLEYNTESSLS